MNIITILFLAGRILFGGYFLMMGINHFMNYKMMSGYASSKGIPLPTFFVIFSGLLLALGGLGVMLGFLFPIALILIILFLVPVTFSMHQFWTIADPMARMGERINFLKNIALIGAALIILAISVTWLYGI